MPSAVQAWFAAHAPCEPASTAEHVAPPLHTWHGPLHVSTQQTPSVEQNPLAQSPPSAPSAPSAHSCPFAFAHVCAAEHAIVVFDWVTRTRIAEHRMPGEQPDAVLDWARAQGSVSYFAMERPSLADLFREAIIS